MAEDVVTGIIERQEWIDRVADPLQKAIRGALRPSAVARALHGTWLGHPLHPALIAIPIGSWSLAAALDAAELIRGRGSNGASDIAIGFGLAGAAASAMTGLADWSQTDGKARKIGVVHATLNIAATALYAASLLTRKKSRKTGIGLAMLAYPMVMASGWLGGHLAFGEQVGVDHTATADQDKPGKFTPVLAEEELAEGKPACVLADGVAVLLVRRDDVVYALANTCTHLGGPLNEGELEGDTIRCPWHGSRFCLDDGSVAEAPAVFPERTFEVRVRNGQIEVRAAR